MSLVRVNLRITPGAVSPELLAALRAVPGVWHLEPLLPGERDPELAGLFVADLLGETAPMSIVALRQEPYVEYVEEPATRALVR